MSDLVFHINGLGNGLITGLQGAGKSHFIMTQIDWLVKNTDINIFLINVNGVTIESPTFQTADMDFNWIDDAPKNSIIIYDEAGTIERFSNSSKTINSDPQVAELTKLRHHGKQVFFVAQDPSLLHPAVRKLMVRHLHFSNPYNDPAKTHCFVFPQVIEKIDGTSKGWQKKAINEFDHELNPDIFPLYQSVAEGANHVKVKQKNNKAQKLFKIAGVVLIIMILAGAGAIYMGFQWYNNFQSQKDNAVKSSSADDKKDGNFIDKTVNTVQSGANPNQLDIDKRIDVDNRKYAREQELYKERLPVDYQILANNDDLRVANIIKMNGKCRALNIHGDLLNIPQSLCNQYLKNPASKVHKSGETRLVTSHEPTDKVSSSPASAPALTSAPASTGKIA